ncbi:hypothetical protein ACTWP4_13865 [Gracilibacillus sp. D59]|uniref:hypothetical protein n=1 Tax=Gracilibacillus sp. D59 TaxID=3457434 RepID=UPI003FCC537F
MKCHELVFTNRMKRIIKLSSQLSEQSVIFPSDIFFAICREATGVCGELHLYLYKKLGADYINLIKSRLHLNQDMPHTCYKEWHLAKATCDIFYAASKKREKYNQIMINEGHVLQSIFEIDKELKLAFTMKWWKKL